MTDEQITDFLVDAEAGNYGWFVYDVIPSHPSVQGRIRELDEDGSPVAFFTFTHATIKRGIVLEAKRQGLSVTDFIEQYDASDADNAVQLGILGEIRYA